MPKRPDIRKVLIIGSGRSSSGRLRVRLFRHSACKACQGSRLRDRPGELQPGRPSMTDPVMA